MSDLFKYFRGAGIFWILGVFICAVFLGPKAAVLMSILAVLEVSLSFDNAVVNAKQLSTMDGVWRGRFLTWGMVIAVFGMRVIFPLSVVSLTTGISPWAAADMAINIPASYAAALSDAHIMIAGLGTAFLSMVALKYFFDKDKEVHWISVLESRLHHLEATEVASTIALLSAMALHLNTKTEILQFLGAGMAGIALHELVEWIGGKLEEGKDLAVGVAKAGLGAFIYLEILDASFSFDGVIGAFAITSNIFIITLGLGTGAFAVRGLTLMLVDKGTLSEYRYLEPAAFYAIASLAVLMGVSTFHEIPDIVTGGIGAVLIGLGFIHSVYDNRG